MVESFGPAFDGYLAVLRVNAHGDAVAAEGLRQFRNKIERLRGPGAHDHSGHPGVECALRRRFVADAAADLARDGDGGGDAGDRLEVPLLAGKRGIQIDDVKVIAPLAPPSACAKATGSSEYTVFSEALPWRRRTTWPPMRSMAGKINMRNNRGETGARQRRPWTKFLSTARPTSWLFSG